MENNKAQDSPGFGVCCNFNLDLSAMLLPEYFDALLKYKEGASWGKVCAELFKAECDFERQADKAKAYIRENYFLAKRIGKALYYPADDSHVKAVEAIEKATGRG